MDDGTEPIADDELLYRRVPEHWYSPESGFDSQAFAPNKKRDLTGLSFFRAKYKSIESVAAGQPGKSYFVAVLRAGDLRQRGIEIVPRPQPNDPGHAELPDLNASNYKSDRTLELQRMLEDLANDTVQGPFGSAAPRQE